jgi:hypothetical protein
MNELEASILKLSNLREIIDSATEAMEADHIKAESLNYAAYEYLGLILNELDENFKKAWNATIINYNKAQILEKWKLRIECDLISDELYVNLSQEMIDFLNLKKDDELQISYHLNDEISIAKV